MRGWTTVAAWRTVAAWTALGLAGCAAEGGDAEAMAGGSDEDGGAVATASLGAGERHGGYEVRLDSERSDPGEFRLDDADGDLRILTGPAGIAWHETDRVDSGDFRVEATFTQYDAPVGYREAYGLFVGGRDLDGPDQEYTYLLLRGTGDFLIKRRRGDTTETIVDWTADPAVMGVVSEGDDPRNVLAVESVDGETRYLVNGQVVHTQPTPEARPHGVVGVRANHRLDVRVADWRVERING